jgi:hypothetical protein
VEFAVVRGGDKDRIALRVANGHGKRGDCAQDLNYRYLFHDNSNAVPADFARDPASNQSWADLTLRAAVHTAEVK